MSYDRRVVKMDLAQVAERNRALITAGTESADRR